LSVVSDTWDFWAVIRDVLPALKERIMARAGCLVIRPDSGDPNLILNGSPNATDPLEKKGLIQCLWDIFGGTTNEYGVRTLDPHIGAIYGDSITLDRQKQILDGLRENKFSPASVVLGIGSYTYQYVTRDTFGFAIKATYAKINGVPTPLFKDPKTDNGVKKSAKGLIFLGNNSMEENVTWERFSSDENRLAPVFTDGVLEAEWDWEHIRTIARNDIF
ncbi:MAG: nicotinate phosphoribosyltransferase, partial [Candidatus Riesia sp.]|nr:nicotinate phosphoribosyltransferase [Candidatus Riesia sp.]